MQEDLGKLILRVGIGIMMLFHGIDKALNGVSFLEGMFASYGLPSFVAYGVYVGEILAPILIIIGLLTRISAAVIAFTMFAAIVLAHRGDIFSLGEHGAWAIETPMLFLVGCVVIILLGSGRYSLDWLRNK